MKVSKTKRPVDYDRSVFINCPFDEEYRSLFRAILFTVQDAGFIARCALETIDGGEVRLTKILGIIAACRFGIHDISRTDLDTTNNLPRFNMPFELGLDLGARAFGRTHHAEKVQLILDRDRYRFQKYLSDIAGQDIAAHGDDPAKVSHKVRDWLRSASKNTSIPGPEKILERLKQFEADLPALCTRIGTSPTTISFAELTTLVYAWLGAHSLSASET